MSTMARVAAGDGAGASTPPPDSTPRTPPFDGAKWLVNYKPRSLPSKLTFMSNLDLVHYCQLATPQVEIFFWFDESGSLPPV